jgi:hypothetical protein
MDMYTNGPCKWNNIMNFQAGPGKITEVGVGAAGPFHRDRYTFSEPVTVMADDTVRIDTTKLQVVIERDNRRQTEALEKILARLDIFIDDEADMRTHSLQLLREIVLRGLGRD